jgi:hypothetical protein
VLGTAALFFAGRWLRKDWWMTVNGSALVQVLPLATWGRCPAAPGGSAGGLDLPGVRRRPGAEEKPGMSGWLRAVLRAVALMVAT